MGSLDALKIYRFVTGIAERYFHHRQNIDQVFQILNFLN
jgi:hypothetical protein